MKRRLLAALVLFTLPLATAFLEARAKPPDRVANRHGPPPSNPHAGPKTSLVEVAQLTASDASDVLGHGFGSSAAIEGDWIAVAAARDGQIAESSGAVYMFRRDGETWVEHQKLVPDDVTQWTYFGGSVAMDGGRLVVACDSPGSPPESYRLGYVFVRDDNGTPGELGDDRWTEETKLIVPRNAPFCCYSSGAGFDIAGDYIVMGQGDFTHLGAVSIFKRIKGRWTYTTSLLGSDTDVGDSFGLPVAISGDRVAVGAAYADDQRGAAYVFRNDHDSWIEEGKLTIDEEGIRRFGESISLDKDSLAVGTGAYTNGRAYVFLSRDGRWNRDAQIHPPDPVGEGYFSAWVTLARKDLFISAWDYSHGVLYFYNRLGQEWRPVQRFDPDYGQPGYGIGGVYDVSGRDVIAYGVLKVYVLRLEN